MLLFVSVPEFSVKHEYFYLGLINKSEITLENF